MDHSGMFDDNLAVARVAADDVRAKLMAANARRCADVDAVVLQATGDSNVLHGSEPLEPHLLDGVAGGQPNTFPNSP